VHHEPLLTISCYNSTGRHRPLSLCRLMLRPLVLPCGTAELWWINTGAYFAVSLTTTQWLGALGHRRSVFLGLFIQVINRLSTNMRLNKNVVVHPPPRKAWR
jgi:hypothetical protein